MLACYAVGPVIQKASAESLRKRTIQHNQHVIILGELWKALLELNLDSVCSDRCA